jgi:hypothetical protein
MDQTDALSRTADRPMSRLSQRVMALLDPLSPWSLAYFISLNAAWWIVRALPEPSSGDFARYYRPIGYLAALAMSVPYIHIARRLFRYRRGRWRMATWMRLHIACSYGAFLAVLLHSHARSGSPITLALLVLTWIVMVSGVIGFYGQKLIYRLMPLIVAREFGLERLGLECEDLRRRAEEWVAAYPAIGGDDVRDWPGVCERLRDEASTLGVAISARLPTRLRSMVGKLSAYGPDDAQKAEILSAVNELLDREDLFGPSDGSMVRDVGEPARSDASASSPKLRNHRRVVRLFGDQIADRSDRTEATERFFQAVLESMLRAPLGLRLRLVGRQSAAAASRNFFLRVKAMAEPGQSQILQDVWDAAEIRRQMDLELWLHGLGRVWLLVHGPAAYVLALFTALHILGSIRYGGL